MIDLDGSFFKKKLRKSGLLLDINKETGKCMVFFEVNDDFENRVLLKEFKDIGSYNSYLVEAFILRMAADRKSVKKARDLFRKLCSFVRERISNTVKVTTFLLLGFLSTGCASDIHVLKSSSEVDVGSGVVRCEYIRNGQISCVNLDKDFENA